MKQEQWQEHIEAYLQTNISKRAYSEKHNLVYSQFLYWFRKHKKDQSKDCNRKLVSTSDFISVMTQPNDQGLNTHLGIMEFPGGIRLEIYHADLLQPLLACFLGRSA